MKTRVEITVPGRISAAEELWYDQRRWATFVDGFHHVVSVDDGWPASGTLVWDSTPGGRGRVAETTERYEPRVSHAVHIEEERLSGTQTVAFAVRGSDKVRMTLELRYELKTQPLGPLTFLMDALFIRPRQREALARTLTRFARELASDRALAEDA